jgi:N-ethylmaleimide reductase
LRIGPLMGPPVAVSIRPVSNPAKSHSMTDVQPLFTPVRLGHVALPNRIVMASMTRGRTNNPGLIPTSLNAEYYAQRAAAGLILSEGTWPGAQAVGYVNAPGMFTDEQAHGWRQVVTAVHQAGGRIVSQLGHVGAMSHPDYFGGELPKGPSAVDPRQRVFTPGGFKETVTPRAMTLDDIDEALEQFGAAAARAFAAEFDGVELHAHQPYLIPQFLNDTLNLRTDDYGGTDERRARFLFEALDRLVAAWGPGRVGIKLNPSLTNVGGFHATERTVSTYEHVFERLNDYPLAYVELMRSTHDATGTPIDRFTGGALRYFRPRYRGSIIANGGFDQASGNAVIEEGLADAVSFAQHFIANPDLVDRFRNGSPLSISELATRYAGDARGYTDYPRAA